VRRLGSFASDQRGVTLVEVLVSVLVLSLGILGLSAMFAYAVQMPRLSAYQSAALGIASSHIDKIRANAAGFQEGAYAKPLSYDGTFHAVPAVTCDFPTCSPRTLADMDSAATSALARKELPAGGILVSCTPQPCSPTSSGNLWVVWQEPRSRFALNAVATDNCPVEVTSRFNDPRPRCLYLPFQP